MICKVRKNVLPLHSNSVSIQPLMHTVISISAVSVSLVISLTCGIVLWLRREEVADRSRLFLSLINFLLAFFFILRLISYLVNPAHQPYNDVLAPLLLIGGLATITFYLTYPIEVIHPGWLNLRRSIFLAAPTILALILPLCGMRYQQLTSLSSLWAHVTDIDVLVRLGLIACVFVCSFLLLFIPHNWRESSADNRWIRRSNLVVIGLSLLFFVQEFTTWPYVHHIHILCICASLAGFTWFEVFERLKPVPVNQAMQADTLWAQICQVVDGWEAWRNPDTTVNSISSAVGTNRIYVARCVKEHTGLTVNDYINRKRVDYMASELKKTPASYKEVYFAAGFRSRQTAYRNFIKFKGVAPTELLLVKEEPS